MASSAASTIPAPALTPLDNADPMSQLRMFVDILTHDDRDSFYTIAVNDPVSIGSEWRETSMTAEKLRGLTPPSPADKRSYYVTRNGFTGHRRLQQDCRQVNALMYDIDFHATDDVRSGVEGAWDLLERSVGAGEVPAPTMVVDTGRGLQVYYVFSRSTSTRKKDGTPNARGLGYIKKIEEGLAFLFESTFDIEGAEVDGSVYDLARVGRLPGTFNYKAGRLSSLLAVGPYADPAVLLPAATAAVPFKTQQRPPCPAVPKKERRRARRINYNGAMMRRLTEIESLQRLRGRRCAGHRENLVFLYYNTAVQVYERATAKKMTAAFNSRYPIPLDPKELDNAFYAVDNVVAAWGPLKGLKGAYPISLAKFIEKAGITEEEKKVLGIGSQARALKRAAAKEATRAKRAHRDREIEKLILSGSTYEAAAAAVGCSRRTVANVVSRLRSERASRTRVPERARRASAEEVCRAVSERVCATICPNAAYTAWSREKELVSRLSVSHGDAKAPSDLPTHPRQGVQIFGRQVVFRCVPRLHKGSVPMRAACPWSSTPCPVFGPPSCVCCPQVSASDPPDVPSSGSSGSCSSPMPPSGSEGGSACGGSDPPARARGA